MADNARPDLEALLIGSRTVRGHLDEFAARAGDHLARVRHGAARCGKVRCGTVPQRRGTAHSIGALAFDEAD